MGAMGTKLISGHEYIYYSYYEDGRKREKYCGLASKPESTKKALQLEIERITKKRDYLSQKIIEMKTKMNEF